MKRAWQTVEKVSRCSECNNIANLAVGDGGAPGSGRSCTLCDNHAAIETLQTQFKDMDVALATLQCRVGTLERRRTATADVVAPGTLCEDNGGECVNLATTKHGSGPTACFLCDECLKYYAGKGCGIKECKDCPALKLSVPAAPVCDVEGCGKEKFGVSSSYAKSYRNLCKFHWDNGVSAVAEPVVAPVPPPFPHPCLICHKPGQPGPMCSECARLDCPTCGKDVDPEVCHRLGGQENIGMFRCSKCARCTCGGLCRINSVCGPCVHAGKIKQLKDELQKLEADGYPRMVIYKDLPKK